MAITIENLPPGGAGNDALPGPGRPGRRTPGGGLRGLLRPVRAVADPGAAGGQRRPRGGADAPAAARGPRRRRRLGARLGAVRHARAAPNCSRRPPRPCCSACSTRTTCACSGSGRCASPAPAPGRGSRTPCAAWTWTRLSAAARDGDDRGPLRLLRPGLPLQPSQQVGACSRPRSQTPRLGAAPVGGWHSWPAFG